MTQLPAFLVRLSLSFEADEREVKRAYARELRLIDQEKDPAGFQSLREAYEAALEWARGPQPGVPVVPPTSVPTPSPLREPADASVPQVQRVEPRQPDSRGQAESLFAEVTQTLYRQPGDLAVAEAELERADRDERLLSLDARETFEWLIVERLARGWVPGNEALFSAAVKRYGWDTEGHYLRRFGSQGARIDRAVLELQLFNELEWEAREKRMELIRRLRTDGDPAEGVLRSQVPLLDELLAAYPILMSTITDGANVRSWLQRGSRFRKPRQVAQPNVARTTPKGIGSRFGPGLLIWIVISALARCAGELPQRSYREPPRTIQFKPEPRENDRNWAQFPNPPGYPASAQGNR